MMVRVVVDADALVYACGFAVERTRYDVSVLRPDGTTVETVKDSRDEVEAWLSDESEDSVRQIDRVVDAEPLANALHLVNRTLTATDQYLTDQGVDFDRMELYITGKGNFREGLATIKGYKANRDPTHRPYHYKSIRRYLKNRWGATEVQGYEADDAVAMIAYECDFDPARLIIAAVDKDLLTIPGRHYHLKKKTMTIVTPGEALAYFYRQLITGDPTDNIGGCWKAGERAAACIQPGDDERLMYKYALDLYTASLEKTGCPYGNLGAESALLENARLLHLRRYVGDVWAPPAQRRMWSGALSSSAGSVPGLTGLESSMDTSPVRSASQCLSRDIVRSAAGSKSSEPPCTPPTSSSVRGPSKRKASSRPKIASGSAPS